MKYLPLVNQLYALQVLEYDFSRYLRWTFENPLRVKLENKKSLVWTSKARFLFCCSLTFLFILFTTTLTPLRSGSLDLKGGVFVFLLFTIFPQPLLLSSLLILRPYEILNRRRTIRQAQKILAGHKTLLVIGITGSYGKTTVKEILANLLSSRYQVLATPASYNTLFGIAGVIKNNLKPEHEIFIVEMGAYKKGEIAELCGMVKPKIGILTGITSQHLERFGDLENIVKAKGELIDALPKDGLAVFNLYSAPCADLYQRTTINKIGYSRINKPHGINPDLQAETSPIIASMDNETMKQWSSLQQNFDIKIRSQLLKSPEEITGLTINLPAEHNVSNALAAIAVGLYLGLSEEEIRKGLGQVKPPEHRLQIIPGAGGSVIIDDAYSSNPEGAKAAVKLITRLSNHPKIIVTPGMVELGKQQFEENKNFGKLIAENFDYAIIVNKTNREALLQGIKDGGWGVPLTMKQWNNKTIDQRLFITDTLDQATKNVIPQLVKPNSLILFENDLPDIYN